MSAAAAAAATMRHTKCRQLDIGRRAAGGGGRGGEPDAAERARHRRERARVSWIDHAQPHDRHAFADRAVGRAHERARRDHR